MPEALHLDPAGGAAGLALLGLEVLTLVSLDAVQLLPGVGLDDSEHSGPGQTGSKERNFTHYLSSRVNKHI